MTQEHDQINPDWEQETLANNDPLMKDVIKRTLKHWPWLVLSLIICCGLGVLWILKTPPSYSESAQVVIKNDSEGSSVASQFNDLGLFSTNANVMNEIATMSSQDIMEEVVKMLNLQTSYFKPGTFHKKALYGKTLPVTVDFPDNNDQQRISFKLTFDPKYGFEVSKLKRYDTESNKWVKSDKTYKGKIGVPVKTEFGTFVVNPTENFSLSENYEIFVDRQSITSAVNSYKTRVKINLANHDSTVIELIMNDENRQRADEILAAIIAIYNDNWIKEKNQVTVSASEFINDRLGVIEKELGNVDANISEYKSSNLVPDVNTMTQSYVKEQEELSKLSVNLEGELQAVRGLRTRLTMAGGEGAALPANTTLENPALQAQIKDYNELLMRRNMLESKSSDKNPMVQQMDNEIDLMRNAILGSVDNAIQGIEGQLRTLQVAKQSNTGRIATSPTQAKYLLSVERQQKVKEDLYLFLLQKREDNALNQAFTAYNTRIIQKPGGDGKPVSPRKGIILFASFLFGLFIPFGYNYYVEKWDNKIRSRKDLEGVKTPMIGEIPLERKVKKNRHGETEQLIVKSGNRDVVNEAFRVLRTNVEFTRIHKDGCNVLVFTSFNPGSGKSLITANLAASLSLKGKRILIIDGDFRRGSASAYVNDPAKGLSDYLAGHRDDINSLILKFPDMENLYILPMGKLAPNPTELIESPKFATLIEQLRNEYDYILIDCPPIEVVADAQIIDTVADRTIFVLRAGLLEKSLLGELDKFYIEKKFKNLAFILNGTTSDKIGYGNGPGSYGNNN